MGIRGFGYDGTSKGTIMGKAGLEWNGFHGWFFLGGRPLGRADGF